MAKRQRFTTEFKRDAVRLWKSSGRPAAAVARELGLRRNHLYKWQNELETHGEAAFPGKGGRAHSTDSSCDRGVRTTPQAGLQPARLTVVTANRHGLTVHSAGFCSWGGQRKTNSISSRKSFIEAQRQA